MTEGASLPGKPSKHQKGRLCASKCKGPNKKNFLKVVRLHSGAHSTPVELKQGHDLVKFNKLGRGHLSEA